MPASVLTLAYLVFRPLLTNMAIYWTQKKKKEFLKVITEIIVCLSGIGVLVMIGCAWLGIPALSWIYVIDLSQYKGTLPIIVLGGCFCTFSYVFDNALVVIRKQNLLVCAYVIAWLYTKTTAHHMVEKWAMAGAAQRWLMQQQC